MATSHGALELKTYVEKDAAKMEAKRIDLVWDQYLINSVKNAVREERGHGIRRQVTGATRLPPKWLDLKKKTLNKIDLFNFLAKSFIAVEGEMAYVTNIGDTIHSSANVNSSLSGLKCSNKEEADGRIILHLKDMVRHGSQNVVVRTVDTDVLVLCRAFYSRLKSLGLQNLWVLFGTGAKRRYLSAHLMAGKSL